MCEYDYMIALYVNGDNVGTSNDATLFDSFGADHFPKEIKTGIWYRKITRNIFRMQAYNSIMCGYFCIAFIDFMLNGKYLFFVFSLRI